MFHSIQRIFQIEQVGFYFDRVFSKEHDFKGERHDFVEIVYVDTGSVCVVENENVYWLGGGDMVLHGPMEFHRIKSDAQTAPHVYNLSVKVSGDLPQRLFDGVYHLNPEQREQYGRCLVLAKRLLEEKSEEPYLDQHLSAALTDLLLGICREEPVDGTPAADSGALIYRRLVRDMQQAVCMNLSLEELAGRNFISVSYVKKLFRIYADVTPKQFYDALRLREAVVLLKKGYPVAQIAEKMGFSSPNFFAMFFKKHMGMTPSSYRKTSGYSKTTDH